MSEEGGSASSKHNLIVFQQDERYHPSQTSAFFGKGPSFGPQDITSCTFGAAIEAVPVEM